MNKIIPIIKNDFKNFKQYNILQTVVILSLLFAGTMIFIPTFDPLILIYITVFVLPVILLAISIYIENEEKTLFPLSMCECTSLEIILAKLLSATLLMIIPFILEILMMIFILNMNFSVILFVLVYLLSLVMHIVVGTVLAIISKSNSMMSLAYIAYIVIFSVMPIFYAEGLIPEAFQYVLVVSPAYLSGILFQEIIYGYTFSPDWLIILAVILQIVYITCLTLWIIKPYFKTYLFLRTSKGE